MTCNKPKVLSAATMSGLLVRNGRDEDLGCVEELMVDPETGKVTFAVLSLGGFIGFGGALHAVPFDRLRLDPDRRVFVLDAEREFLESAPRFDEENWPDFADPEWTGRVYDHYSLQQQAA